ncbi:hypothetical protein MKX52_09060 [Bacillus sp. FSL R5-0422]|uniref:hypothetical protein n=1 Tax=Bacillus sp. FSL R5-0422 TaxID=2921577 RepID=UPI00315AEDCF
MDWKMPSCVKPVKRRGDVILTKEDKAPTLQDVRQDLESLLDFSIMRWFLEADVIDALKQHDQQRILNSVQNRFNETQHIEVKSRMLEIAANVLDTSATGWVRELVNQAGGLEPSNLG